MIVAQCDFCLRCVEPHLSVGWIAMQRLQPSRPDLSHVPEFMRGMFPQQDEPEPSSSDPLVQPRRFCTEQCAVGFLTSGCRSFVDAGWPQQGEGL